MMAILPGSGSSADAHLRRLALPPVRQLGSRRGLIRSAQSGRSSVRSVATTLPGCPERHLTELGAHAGDRLLRERQVGREGDDQ